MRRFCGVGFRIWAEGGESKDKMSCGEEYMRLARVLARCMNEGGVSIRLTDWLCVGFPRPYVAWVLFSRLSLCGTTSAKVKYINQPFYRILLLQISSHPIPRRLKTWSLGEAETTVDNLSVVRIFDITVDSTPDPAGKIDENYC